MENNRYLQRILVGQEWLYVQVKLQRLDGDHPQSQIAGNADASWVQVIDDTTLNGVVVLHCLLPATAATKSDAAARRARNDDPQSAPSKPK